LGDAIATEQMATIRRRINPADKPFFIPDNDAHAGGKWGIHLRTLFLYLLITIAKRGKGLIAASVEVNVDAVMAWISAKHGDPSVISTL
jgi:hypothetical protein